ncbi:unnamed protein product [Jaminaea pallidilutea]
MAASGSYHPGLRRGNPSHNSASHHRHPSLTHSTASHKSPNNHLHSNPSLAATGAASSSGSFYPGAHLPHHQGQTPSSGPQQGFDTGVGGSTTVNGGLTSSYHQQAGPSTGPSILQHPGPPHPRYEFGGTPGGGGGSVSNDAVLDAVERLGKNLGGQLSTLSVQMSSLLSLMSQLVEGDDRRLLKRIESHGHLQGGMPAQPHGLPQQSAPAFPPEDSSSWHRDDARHSPYRRPSNNPFAFDPNVDEVGRQRENAEFHQTSYEPPTTADSHRAPPMFPNGMPPQPLQQHQSGQVNGTNDANGMNGLAAFASEGPSVMFSNSSVTFDGAGQGEEQRHRPTSSYGSVRPFTAVDHSQRPVPNAAQQRHANEQEQHQQDRDLGVHFQLRNGNNSTGMDHDGAQRDSSQMYNERRYFDANGSTAGLMPPAYGFTSDSPTMQPNTAPTTRAMKRVGRMSGSSLVGPRKRRASLLDGEDDEGMYGGSGSGGGGDYDDEEDEIDHSMTSAPGGSMDAPSPDTSSVNGVQGSNRPMGTWKFWSFTPPQVPEHQLQSLPPVRWRTLHQARLDLQRKTGRSMAKLGRLPLKDYLEVGPSEYLAARKSGRAAYQEWLDPLKRLAKQEPEKVRACTNFMEYNHPMLAQCEGNFKSRQLLQQIIDNAIDEATNAKKKAGYSGPGGGGGGSVAAVNGRSTESVSSTGQPQQGSASGSKDEDGSAGSVTGINGYANGE